MLYGELVPRQRTTPVPIRIDALLLERLVRAAQKMGTSRSSVIRLAILNQLPEIEGGKINLRFAGPRCAR